MLASVPGRETPGLRAGSPPAPPTESAVSIIATISGRIGPRRRVMDQGSPGAPRFARLVVVAPVWGPSYIVALHRLWAVVCGRCSGEMLLRATKRA